MLACLPSRGSIGSDLLPCHVLSLQLNGQTQRLLGQQSLAAYTGLQARPPCGATLTGAGEGGGR